MNTTISLESLVELVELLGKYAHKILVEEGETDLMPLYHLMFPPPQQDLIIGCPWNGTEEKLAMVAEIKRIARERGAIAAGFCSETWMVIRKEFHPNDDPPSQLPDRQECVFATATNGRRTVAGRWQMIRDKPSGKLLELRQDGEIREGDYSGRLLDGLVAPVAP